MRKFVSSTLLSTAFCAMAALPCLAPSVAAGEDFFDNPRLVTDGMPQGPIFRPVVPPATVGYPTQTADPVYRTYTSEPAPGSGPFYVFEPLGTADLAVDVPPAIPTGSGTANIATSTPAAAAVTADPNAAGQNSPTVVSFVVPVEIQAQVAAPTPQQYQQQYDALQRQYADQIRNLQNEYAARVRQQQEMYAEELRQQRTQQEQYAVQAQQQRAQQEQYAEQVRQQRERQEQYMAQVQQYRLQQEQHAAQARQRQAMYAAQMQEELQRQQQEQQRQLQLQQQLMPAQQPRVLQFPPDQPIPAQPAQRLPQQQQSYPAPAADVPLTASRPTDFGLAQPAPATPPMQAGDYASSLTHPSTGGDRPVLTLITPAEVKQALNQGVRLILLDVRGELVRDVEGHIPGDIGVPYEPAETFPARVRQAIPNANLPVVVYCRDGIWSSKAGEVMARMGYRTYLMGAYRLWLWN